MCKYSILLDFALAKSNIPYTKAFFPPANIGLRDLKTPAHEQFLLTLSNCPGIFFIIFFPCFLCFYLFVGDNYALKLLQYIHKFCAHENHLTIKSFNGTIKFPRCWFKLSFPNLICS